MPFYKVSNVRCWNFLFSIDTVEISFGILIVSRDKENTNT